jgi:glutaminase
MASPERHYVSTGHLPAPEMVQSLVQHTHRRSKPNSDGKNSQAYPALARVPSELFGICVVGTGGRISVAGSGVWLAVVTAMRISSQFPETKSFVFALPLTRLSICLGVARAATEASKLPIASDGVFLRRAA